MDLEVITHEIKSRYQQPDTLFLVGIDGRSGSGKTSFAEKLKEGLPDTTIIHLDPFDLYKGELSVSRVINEVLDPLRNKNQQGIVIIEGVFALSHRLQAFYDYKIWIECPVELGFERGLKRDLQFNGIDNSNEWITYWLPKEEEYIKREKPQEKADYIIKI